MARILVLGAGFAGLWAAVGAARKLEEIGSRASEVEVLVVDRNPYHNVRVRNYEADLGDVTIALGEVLDLIGVKYLTAEVESIDVGQQQVAVATAGGRELLSYDRLVLALGSELARPEIPGLADHGFDVDTYAAAIRGVPFTLQAGTGKSSRLAVIKQTINRKRIYPPRPGTREDILAAAAPIVQAPPQYRGSGGDPFKS
jgi:NADH dehydrogenase FAD-containing subunit